ncbi:MAG: hypothetical protein H7232_19310 [Aeromicrobium sp.]|nr:hypothetical protein [Burkholderiales bacterium]
MNSAAVAGLIAVRSGFKKIYEEIAAVTNESTAIKAKSTIPRLRDRSDKETAGSNRKAITPQNDKGNRHASQAAHPNIASVPCLLGISIFPCSAPIAMYRNIATSGK